MQRDLGPQRRGSWVGIEVEGRWSGLNTLFVAESKIPILDANIAHLYFLWEAWTEGSQGFWFGVRQLLEKFPVTFEVPVRFINDLPKDIVCHPSVRVQLTVPVGDEALAALKRLRGMDELRLDASPFNAVLVEKRLLSITVPEDYKGDTAV